jgi:predicted phage terminase large subunit-like protein
LLLIQREDPAMFSAQYLNKPSTGGTQLFTNEKMLACVVAEKDAPALSAAVLFVDLASGQDVQADDSVILCGKTDHLANMYVADGIGGQWTTSTLAMQLIQMSLKHRPIKIMIEKTASSTYFVAYLRIVCRDMNVVLPIDFIPINNTKDAKLIRISSLEGHVRTKRLKFFALLPCWEKMLSQFVEFPKARYGHDDYPDTVALMAQTFGTSYRPVTPLSSMRHPLLEEMARLEQQQAASGIFTQDGQLIQHAQDSMGAEFD